MKQSDLGDLYRQRTLEHENALTELRSALVLASNWEPWHKEEAKPMLAHVRAAMKALGDVHETLREEIAAATGQTRLLDIWPEPTMDEPDLEQIGEWVFDSICEATDGCTVEPDGVCPHGYPSWLLYMGLI